MIVTLGRQTIHPKRRFDMNNKDNAVALITDAYSGIGLVTAKALQRAAYRVFGTSGRAIVLVNGRDESAK